MTTASAAAVPHQHPIEALIAAHSARVYRAALGFLGDEQAAREATQDALLKAYAARERYNPSLPFYPWMYRILKNTCLDDLRRRRQRGISDPEVERLTTSEPSPLEAASRSEEERRLWRAMASLSAPHQEILSLRHLQDLSYDEIATVLGVAEGTVMSRLYRARQALAAAMKDIKEVP